MSRAISTVLDASLCVLLVTAAAVALVTIPGGTARPPDPDASARTVLASTTTATYTGANGTRRVVSGRVGTLLAHAAVADARGTDRRFVDGVRTAVRRVLADANRRVRVTAAWHGGRVGVGERPPPGAAVAAVTHRIVADGGRVNVTVETWSP